MTRPWSPPSWHRVRCAYCRERYAVNRDHVVPKSYRKHRPTDSIPTHLRETVPACFQCNLRKGTRRLVPPSWADRLDELNEVLPGVPWRVWDGNPKAPAFSEVWR